MIIKKIELKNFRNYENLSLSFDPEINIFIGNNAQGKTNLIEALYYCSLGRSFRTRKDREMIRFGSDSFRIRLEGEKGGEENIIELCFDDSGKKKISINKIPITKISQLINENYMVIFSPDDLKLIKEEPDKRRKFMDREICMIKPKYLNALSAYKKLLQNRNFYLREGNPDMSYLDVLDISLAQYGKTIVEERREFIKKMNVICAGIHNGITEGKEKIELIYDNDCDEKVIYEELCINRKKDMKTGSTSKGPHRDDIIVNINDIPARAYGSQGQQRTAALSLKLAELQLIKDETGEDAILLLDDVLSELDKRRQEYLIRTLSSNQLFVTTTEIHEELQKLDGKVFHVEKGKII